MEHSGWSKDEWCALVGIVVFFSMLAGFFGGLAAGHSDMDCQHQFTIEHGACAEVEDKARCHDDAVRNVEVCMRGGER